MLRTFLFQLTLLMAICLVVAMIMYIGDGAILNLSQIARSERYAFDISFVEYLGVSVFLCVPAYILYYILYYLLKLTGSKIELRWRIFISLFCFLTFFVVASSMWYPPDTFFRPQIMKNIFALAIAAVLIPVMRNLYFKRDAQMRNGRS